MMIFALASPALAVPAPTGPHLVSHRDLVFVDGLFGQGQVEARLYYPATASAPGAPAEGGPYPLVAMMHGWLGQAWMYDGICEALASHGFVVASTDTETGLLLNMEALAWDTVASLHYVEAGSEVPGSWLEGLISDAPWSAMGHSMGGATLARLVDAEPRIEQIAAFMPYLGEAGDYARLEAFPGAALYLSGTHDTTAPPEMTDDWFARFSGTRGLSLQIAGAGHQGVTDDPWGTVTPMPHAQQLEITHDLTVAFFLAEVSGQEERYRDLIGPGAPEVFAQARSASSAPALWAEVEPGDVLELGVAGEPGDHATIWLGTGPIDTGADAGLLAGSQVLASDLELIDGLLQHSAALPQEWEQDLWVQVELDEQRFTRRILLREGAEGPPTDPTGTVPTDTVSTPEEPPPGGGEQPAEGGCSTAPAAPASIVGLVLALIGLRRSRR